MLWQGQDDNVRIYVIKDRVEKSGPKWATSDEAQAQIAPEQEVVALPKPKVGGPKTPENAKFQVVPENIVKTQDDAKKMVQALFEESKARQVQKLQNNNKNKESSQNIVPNLKESSHSIPAAAPQNIVSQIVVPVVPIVPSPPKKIAFENQKIKLESIQSSGSVPVSGGFKTTPITPTTSNAKPTAAVLKTNTNNSSSSTPQNVQLSSTKINPPHTSTSSPEVQRRRTLTQIRSEQQQKKLMQNSEELMPSPELKDRAKNDNVVVAPKKIIIKKLKNKNIDKTSVPVIKSIENATKEATKSISNIKINKSPLKKTNNKKTCSTTPKNNSNNDSSFKNNKSQLRKTSDNRINNRYEKALQNAKMRQNMRLWAVNKEQKFFE